MLIPVGTTNVHVFDRKPIPTKWIGVIVLGTIWILSGSRPAAVAQNSPRAADVLLHLRTDELPTPVVFANNPYRRVTSVELEGVVHGSGHGKGLLTFHANTVQFNEFGDARIVETGRGTPAPVILRRIKADDSREPRRLYEIRFAEGAFPKRMLLVLSDGARRPHRLLIAGITAPDNQDLALEHALDLHGAPAIEEPSPDLPLGREIHLETLSPNSDRIGGGLRPTRILGPVDGLVTFEANPNIFAFNVFGDTSYATLMGFDPPKVVLKPTNLADPANQGRRLFAIDLERDKGAYFLVLAGTAAGPHRLLIKEDGTLTQVLHLHDAARPTASHGAANDRRAVKPGQ